MDVREKLEVIAHLGDHITYKEDIGICYDSALAKVIEDAYMELKNGVTVQERGNWKYYHKQNKAVCTNCSFERDLDANFGKAISCPNCGAYMPQPPKGE